MLPITPTYLRTAPDLKAMFLSMSTLAAVALPILLQLPLSVALVFGFSFALRLVLLRLGILNLHPVLSFGMTALVGLFTGLQLGTLVGLEGGSAFLLLMTLLKSYEGGTRRDWQVLIVAILFLLAAAILFDQGLIMSLWAMVCLLMMTTSLAVLNELSFATAFKRSLQGFLLAFLPMVVLFVGMPRRETPFWGLPQIKSNQATTGMSDTMKPGSISDLVQSNEPAFSATFDNGYVPQQKDLYWRVMILARHNGSAWEAVRDFIDEAQSHSANPVQYHILLEDDKGRVPALDYPVNVQKQRGLRQEAGNVVRVWSRTGVRRIRLQSNMSDELPHHLGKFMQQNYYTRLPENLNPRTHALAKQLWQQAGGDTQAFVQAAYSYFKNQSFTYTLKPPLLTSPHTTDEFLFNSKLGFCEHYADAFVVLMRAAGVPARVVIGYQGGEYNEEGGFWQIRSKDAHAWAEVWLPEKQVWKRVDPTSAVSATRIDSSIEQALLNDEGGLQLQNNRFTQYIDQGRYYWQAWIVDYDSTRQQNLFRFLGFSGANGMSILIFVLVGMGVALLPILWWWRRTHIAPLPPLEYGFLLLKQKLLDKNTSIASIAPNELRQMLAEQNRLPEELNTLLNDYIQLRYGQHSAPSAQAAQAWFKRAKQLARKYDIDKKSKQK